MSDNVDNAVEEEVMEDTVSEPEDTAVAAPDPASGKSVMPDKAKNENYSQASFEQLQDSSSALPANEANLDMILDIPVTISMELGRSKIDIRNLLRLNQGSVVELNRLAGEPMDVMVNGTLIAHGEVVVVNDKFGIRLTDVISPAERIKKLK